MMGSLLAFSSKVHASGLSLGIDPPIIQIEAKPPASVKTAITIENASDQPTILRIVLKAFTASSLENGQPQYYPDSDPRSNPSIFKHIQIAENDHIKDTISLGPKQKKTVSMHIGIDKDEALDDHYFSVIFVSESASKGNPLQNSSQTPAGIATNVLLTLGPKGPATGTIEQFSTPLFVQRGPVPFTLRINNTSDHAIVPKGEILIKNMYGQTVGRVDLLPVNILAKSTRAIPDMLQSPEATPPSNFKFQISNFKFLNAYWYESFLFGPYTATLTVSLSDQGPLYRRKLMFFAFPIEASIALTAIIIIGIILTAKVKKRMKR